MSYDKVSPGKKIPEIFNVIIEIPMNADPVKYLLAIRYIDTLKEMVSGKDNKVIYMPFEASNVLGSIGGIKELLNGSKS
jgi:regulator of protease activity HflC (stomatin/prohibitin superfamily)